MSSPWTSNSIDPLVVPAASDTSSKTQSSRLPSPLSEYEPLEGASEMVGSAPGGSAIEMRTLCNEMDVFSSSYSRLTVQVPLSDEGQQLTSREQRREFSTIRRNLENQPKRTR